MSMEEFFGPPVSVYTRAQAIEDGVLVDVTETAKEAGFRVPVALTRGVWAECVAVPRGVRGQDEVGRLWDVVWMLGFAVRANSRRGGRSLTFAVHVRKDNRERTPAAMWLRAEIGPGDEGEPVVTVLLPGED